MSLSRDEVLSRGWQWEDKIPGIFVKENIKTEEISDSILDVDENIFQKYLNVLIAQKIII